MPPRIGDGAGPLQVRADVGDGGATQAEGPAEAVLGEGEGTPLHAAIGQQQHGIEITLYCAIMSHSLPRVVQSNTPVDANDLTLSFR